MFNNRIKEWIKYEIYLCGMVAFFIGTFLLGVFDGLTDDQLPRGPSHYAEPFAADTFLKMPLNALVNVSYIVVGVVWLLRIYNWPSSHHMQLFSVFALWSITYGPVQFYRIVSQSRLGSVLDQWITLPIFSWVVVWNLVQDDIMQMRNAVTVVLLISVSSYGLLLIYTYGFEMALVVHIISAIITTYPTLKKSPVVWSSFVAAILCCCGFVLLKIFDHSVSFTFFNLPLTGHFLSKICDALQIHFVADVFWKHLQYQDSLRSERGDKRNRVKISYYPFGSSRSICP